MRWLALLLLVSLPAFGANKFIRDGASGSTCADWGSNACDDFPTYDNFVRGDTYYVADGTYSVPNMATAESGSQYITIKKCSASDHGTETGYVSTYCDGTAQLGSPGTITVQTGYWIVDGSYRNATWNTVDSYGFRALGITVNTDYSPDFVTFKYMEVGGTYSESYNNLSRSFYIVTFLGAGTMTDWTVSHNFIHNTGEMQLIGIDGIILEYNWFGPTWGKEIIRSQGSGENVTIRYNVFKNGCRDEHAPGEGCTAEIGFFANVGDTPAFEGTKIYGNVIWKNTSQHKTDASIGIQANDCFIYNNTQYDDSDTGVGTMRCGSPNAGDGGTVRNNISYCPNGMSCGFTAATQNNNSTYTSSPPFVDATNGDFHLTGALSGASLASPYDEDLEGTTRGGDGTFDRGAFEYEEGGLNAPTNFRLISLAGLFMGLVSLLGKGAGFLMSARYA